MQTTRKFVVILLLVMVCAASPGACPIPNPLPLRSLVAASELIVTAKLDRVLAPVNVERPRPVPVQLRIARALKGETREQTITAQLWPFQLKQLLSATELLIFLRATPESDVYAPAGEREEDIKNLSAQALEAYCARIGELLEIERLTDPALKQQQTIDWLLRCTEEPLTRWEGAYDLAYGSYAVAGVENGKTQERAFTELLDDAQKQRLTQLLYQSARLAVGDLALLSLIEQWEDENFIPFLWSYLKAGRQDDPEIARQLIWRIAEAVAKAEAGDLIDEYDSAINGSDDEEHPRPPSDPAKALDEFCKRIESYGPPRLVYIKSEER